MVKGHKNDKKRPKFHNLKVGPDGNRERKNWHKDRKNAHKPRNGLIHNKRGLMSPLCIFLTPKITTERPKQKDKIVATNPNSPKQP